MRAIHCGIAAVVSIITISLLTSCAAYQRIEITDSLEGKVRVRDKVRIGFNDGQNRKLIVTQVTPTKIASYDETVPLTEIRRLEKQQISAGRTALASGALAGLFLTPQIGLAVLVGSYVTLTIANYGGN